MTAASIPYLFVPVFAWPSAPGGKLHTYLAGGTTPATTYAADGVTPNTNPVTLDSEGTAVVRLSQSVAYHFVLNDATDTTTLWDADTYQSSYVTAASIVTQANVSQALWPQTAAEIAAGVTPTAYQYPPYTMMRYGLDPSGAADSTSAINTCLAVAATAGLAKVKVGLPSASIKIAGTVSWPVDLVGIDWEGAQLNCTITTGYVVQPTYTTTSTGKDLVAMIKSHPMENFSAYGPCTPGNLSALSASGFANLTDPTGGGSMPGVTFRNGGTYNFYTHFLFGSGAFFDLIDNWDFNTQFGGANFQFLSVPGGTNSGERNTVVNSRFGITYATNATGGTGAAAINQANGNADTRIVNCSFNGAGQTNMRFFTVSGGRVYFNGCHFESSTDAEYWGYVTGSNSSAFIDQYGIFLDAAKSATPCFYCDASVTNGSLTFGAGAYNAQTNSVPLVGGAGPVKMVAAPDNYASGNSYPNYIALSLNLLADPIFASGALTKDGWTAGGGTNPTVEGTNPFSGTKDVKFSMVTGQTNFITSRKFACGPNQRVFVQVQMALTGFTTGTTFYTQLQYLSADGTVLGSQTFASLGANAAYAPFATNGSGGAFPAPGGTVAAQLQTAISGGTTGAAGYLGQVILNLPPV